MNQACNPIDEVIDITCLLNQNQVHNLKFCVRTLIQIQVLSEYRPQHINRIRNLQLALDRIFGLSVE